MRRHERSPGARSRPASRRGPSVRPDQRAPAHLELTGRARGCRKQPPSSSNAASPQARVGDGSASTSTRRWGRSEYGVAARSRPPRRGTPEWNECCQMLDQLEAGDAAVAGGSVSSASRTRVRSCRRKRGRPGARAPRRPRSALRGRRVRFLGEVDEHRPPRIAPAEDGAAATPLAAAEVAPDLAVQDQARAAR